MAVNVVYGSGKAAEALAKFLCCSGSRVAVVGAGREENNKLVQQLHQDSQRAIPFQFIDDLRHQEEYARRLSSRLSFHSSIGSINEEVNVVFDALDGKEDCLHETRKILPRVAVASLEETAELRDEFHVALRLYHPIEYTKIAQLIYTNATNGSAVAILRKTLEKAGIHEVSGPAVDEAAAVVSLWSGSDASHLENAVGALLGLRASSHAHDILH